MSSENVAVVLDWVERVWNRKEPGAIAHFLTEETIAHGMGPNGTDLVGMEPFAQAHALFCQAFPDVHITVGPVVAEGDKVTAFLTCTATYAGDSLGVPGSGQTVVFNVMTMARIENGKVLEGWNVMDLLSVFRQIGTVRVAESLP